MPLVVRNEDVQWRELVPGVWQRPIVSQETGATAILMGHVRLDPGAHLPLHYHDVEDIVMVQSGHGQIVIEGEPYELRAGLTFIIPPGARHELRNTGPESVHIVFGFPSVSPGRFWAR